MKAHGDERGGALLAALTLLATAGLLTVGMAVLSQLHRSEVAQAVQSGRSRYVAEGALNRIRWLIEADRELYPDAVPGEVDYGDYDFDRYLADGVLHQLDYYGTPVEFTITDAATGLALASGDTDELGYLAYSRTTESSLSDAIAIFQTRIGDYLDSDDTVGVDGLELTDYEALGLEPLPRNAAMEYREELLWIPEAAKFLPLDEYGRLTSVQPVAAAAYGSGDGLPNIFTAGYTLLWTYGGLEKDEAARVLAALEVWRRERTSLEDQLDGELLIKLEQSFGFNESGLYTVTITRAAGEGEATTRLSATFGAEGVGAPSSGAATYYEWLRL